MSDSQFTQPEDITAPRQKWTLIKVLYKGDPEGYSVALGKWEGEPCLAIRWNACDYRPVGHPHTRGLPTWFILPEPLVEPVLNTLPADMQSLASAVMGCR